MKCIRTAMNLRSRPGGPADILPRRAVASGEDGVEFFLELGKIRMGVAVRVGAPRLDGESAVRARSYSSKGVMVRSLPCLPWIWTVPLPANCFARSTASCRCLEHGDSTGPCVWRRSGCTLPVGRNLKMEIPGNIYEPHIYQYHFAGRDSKFTNDDGEHTPGPGNRLGPLRSHTHGKWRFSRAFRGLGNQSRRSDCRSDRTDHNLPDGERTAGDRWGHRPGRRHSEIDEQARGRPADHSDAGRTGMGRLGPQGVAAVVQ